MYAINTNTAQHNNAAKPASRAITTPERAAGTGTVSTGLSDVTVPAGVVVCVDDTVLDDDSVDNDDDTVESVGSAVGGTVGCDAVGSVVGVAIGTTPCVVGVGCEIVAGVGACDTSGGNVAGVGGCDGVGTGGVGVVCVEWQNKHQSNHFIVNSDYSSCCWKRIAEARFNDIIVSIRQQYFIQLHKLFLFIFFVNKITSTTNKNNNNNNIQNHQ